MESWKEGHTSGRCAEGKAERDLQRGLVPTSPLQPETVVHLPAGVGGGWVLWLRLWRSDPRERSGVGCVKTA